MKFSAVPLFRAVFPVLLIVAGGCSIFPTPDNTETLYYDLDIPERCNTVRVGQVIKIPQLPSRSR